MRAGNESTRRDFVITTIAKQDNECPDSVSRLSVDLPCAKCGYNLRGQMMGGQCSECGESLTASLAEDRLLFEDPKWLASIVRGLTVALWSMAISGGLVLSVIGGLSAWTASGRALPGLRTVVHEFESGRATGTYNAYLDPVQMLLGVVFVLPIMGAVLLTARPRRVALTPRKGDTSRRVSRVSAVVCIVLALAPCVLFDLVAVKVHKLSNGVFVGPANVPVKIGLFLALAVSLAVAASSFVRWLRSLADRIPNDRLTNWSRIISVLLPAALVLYLWTEGYAAVFSALAPSFAAMIITTIFFATVFALLVFHRRALRNVAENCVSLPELLSPGPESAPRGS